MLSIHLLLVNIILSCINHALSHPLTLKISNFLTTITTITTSNNIFILVSGEFSMLNFPGEMKKVHYHGDGILSPLTVNFHTDSAINLIHRLLNFKIYADK